MGISIGDGISTGGGGGVGVTVPPSAVSLIPFANDTARDNWASANLGDLVQAQSVISVSGTPDTWLRWSGPTNPGTYDAANWIDATDIVQGPPGDATDLSDLDNLDVPVFSSNSGKLEKSAITQAGTGDINIAGSVTTSGGSMSVGTTVSISQAGATIGLLDRRNDERYLPVVYEYDSGLGVSNPFAYDLQTTSTVVSQPDDSVTIIADPVIFQVTTTTPANTVRHVVAVKIRLASAMNNVRIRIRANDASGPILRNIPPNLSAFENGGGLNLPAGEVVFDLSSSDADSPGVFNLGFIPFQLEQGDIINVEIVATTVSLLGNNAGVPYVAFDVIDGPRQLIPYYNDQLVNTGELVEWDAALGGISPAGILRVDVGGVNQYQVGGTLRLPGSPDEGLFFTGAGNISPLNNGDIAYTNNNVTRSLERYTGDLFRIDVVDALTINGPSGSMYVYDGPGVATWTLRPIGFGGSGVESIANGYILWIENFSAHAITLTAGGTDSFLNLGTSVTLGAGSFNYIIVNGASWDLVQILTGLEFEGGGGAAYTGTVSLVAGTSAANMSAGTLVTRKHYTAGLNEVAAAETISVADWAAQSVLHDYTVFGIVQTAGTIVAEQNIDVARFGVVAMALNTTSDTELVAGAKLFLGQDASGNLAIEWDNTVATYATCGRVLESAGTVGADRIYSIYFNFDLIAQSRQYEPENFNTSIVVASQSPFAAFPGKTLVISAVNGNVNIIIPNSTNSYFPIIIDAILGASPGGNIVTFLRSSTDTFYYYSGNTGTIESDIDIVADRFTRFKLIPEPGNNRWRIIF